MNTPEIAIWSAMAGALMVLLVAAISDFVVRPTLPALRGVLFVLCTGSASVLVCGLPEALVPALAGFGMLVAKCAMGPLSSALSLHYLGIWADTNRDDPPTRRIAFWGTAALVLAGVVLGGMALAGAASPSHLLVATGGVNAVSVMLAGVVAVRAAVLGDRLARWMVLGCLCLAGMVAGLYARALDLFHGANWLWLLTAVSTVASFMVVISLTVQRNREQRKLRDLARVAGDGNYPVRVLGAGQLLRQVDDALWRSARLQRRCTVVAVSVPNLYQPVEGAGVEADEPILVTLAARLRRLVGFRNVVGLYHPRCFVMAVSSAQDARRGAVEARDIVAQLRRPIRLLGGPLETSITPTIGVGLVHVMVTGGPVLEIVNLAEKLALEAASHPQHWVATEWDQQANPPTIPGPLTPR